MRLYLDQMLRVDLADFLRTEGHDVLRASEVGQQTADDAEILAKAIEEDRILVTLDEHFGDWAILPLHEHPGVIRVKAHPATTALILPLLQPLLSQHVAIQFRNHLVIVSRSSQRWIQTA